MSERLRVALSGCHRMLTKQPGSHNWAAAFAAVPETEMVAVFDRGAEARAAFVSCWAGDAGAAREIGQFDDFELMVREVKPDIVCVATRQTMHADQVELAIAAGARGIVCDKPLATSLTEVDRITGMCCTGGAPLAFGLDRRWTTRYRWARELIAEGAIGVVVAVTAYGLINLINHGCHWYDAALMLAGDPEVTWASGLVDDVSNEPVDSAKRLDPAGRAQVGLANGVTLYVTPDGKPGPAFEVIGTTGRLLLLNDARDAYLWRSGTSGRVEPQPTERPEAAEGWEAGPALVADLVGAMGTGGQTACDVEEARRASEVGFAIHASSGEGGRRVALEKVDRARRVESLKWGNE